MATSAQTLSLIIDELLANKPANREAALLHLSAKGLLPKKLTEVPKVKKTSVFASKSAEEFVEAHSLTIPEDFKGTGNNGKITVKDLKALAEGVKKPKANVSPSAAQYARDNNIDLATIKGSGTDGKILLKDLKAASPEEKPKSPKTPKSPKSPVSKVKLSPGAAKLAKKNEIQETDLEGVTGTGKDGIITKKDLELWIDDDSDDSDDSDSDSESDEE